MTDTVDVQAKEVNPLDDFVVTFEMSVKEVNTLLNVLNTPNQVPTTTFAAFINMIQTQAGPQAQKAQENLDAVKKAQDEPQTIT
jgi:hypothetical protein